MTPTAVPIPRPSDDQAPVADPVEQQGGDDGDGHADGGDQVAALGGGRVGALFDAEDEEREGDDVERGGAVAARLEHGERDHLAAALTSVLGLRVSAFCDEHAEHPVGDHEAADDVDRAEGDRDRRRSRTRAPSSAKPTTIRPPSMTMPWIALVCDISGVCRVVGTFEITSKPTKAASTKIVISVIRSIMTLRRPRSFVRISPPWVMQAAAMMSSSKSRLSVALLGRPAGRAGSRGSWRRAARRGPASRSAG